MTPEAISSASNTSPSFATVVLVNPQIGTVFPVNEETPSLTPKPSPRPTWQHPRQAWPHWSPRWLRPRPTWRHLHRASAPSPIFATVVLVRSPAVLILPRAAHARGHISPSLKRQLSTVTKLVAPCCEATHFGPQFALAAVLEQLSRKPDLRHLPSRPPRAISFSVPYHKRCRSSSVPAGS